jgi:hypothetical protein
MRFGIRHIGRKPRQPLTVRSVERHEIALGEAKSQIGAHFLNALQGSGARLRNGTGIIG